MNREEFEKKYGKGILPPLSTSAPAPTPTPTPIVTPSSTVAPATEISQEEFNKKYQVNTAPVDKSPAPYQPQGWGEKLMASVAPAGKAILGGVADVAKEAGKWGAGGLLTLGQGAVDMGNLVTGGNRPMLSGTPLEVPGLGEVKPWFTNPETAKRLEGDPNAKPIDIGREVVAPYVQKGAEALSVATLPATSGMGLLGGSLAGGGLYGLTTGTAEAAGQYADTGKINPIQVGGKALENTAWGVGGELAGRTIIGPVLNKIVGGASKAISGESGLGIGVALRAKLGGNMLNFNRAATRAAVENVDEVTRLAAEGKGAAEGLVEGKAMVRDAYQSAQARYGAEADLIAKSSPNIPVTIRPSLVDDAISIVQKDRAFAPIVSELVDAQTGLAKNLSAREAFRIYADINREMLSITKKDPVFKEAKAFRDAYRKSITDTLGESADVLLSNYAKQMNDINNGNKLFNALGLSADDAAKNDTALSKINTIYNDNKKNILQSVRNLQLSTGKNIEPYIIAQQWTRQPGVQIHTAGGAFWTRQGLASKIFQYVGDPTGKFLLKGAKNLPKDWQKFYRPGIKPALQQITPEMVGELTAKSRAIPRKLPVRNITSAKPMPLTNFTPEQINQALSRIALTQSQAKSFLVQQGIPEELADQIIKKVAPKGTQFVNTVKMIDLVEKLFTKTPPMTPRPKFTNVPKDLKPKLDKEIVAPWNNPNLQRQLPVEQFDEFLKKQAK